MNLGNLFSGPDMASRLMPEWILVIGIIAMILVPNLGNATFRLPIPGKSWRVPYFIGGKRFSFTGDPRLPQAIAAFTLFASFITALLSQILDSGVGVSETCIAITEGAVNVGSNWCSSDATILRVDAFSRLMELIFIGALLIAVIANWDRLPATPHHRIAVKKQRDEAVENRRLMRLLNNRRQVDFYLLVLMVALGMSTVALSANLFMLFVGLELASMASYVLITFNKETEIGPEAGVKYFIVGSVASAIGLYGMSMLYLWNGDLSISSLATAWAEGPNGMASIGLGMMLVAFGFKISAVPFHFATPDAYAGASGPVAGVLSTASKAMGFVALMRVLIGITLADDGSAWTILIGVIAAITMTWGNIAALGSRNPKRMLAYSSVAHAGYILAGIAAIGALGPGDGSELIATAIIFHLAVLVTFKLGAFLVISLLECEGRGHKLEHYHGLARRDPLIAISMMVFMLALAGVPPLSGFLSKLMMVSGIISSTVGDVSGASLSDAMGSLSWVFWLAILLFINSAISLFYYLRICVVMFYDETDRNLRLSRAPMIRIAIMLCTMGAVVFGFGPLAEVLALAANDASMALFG
jgi:proton-translocating NADH-quinone oxidoreductase chain N